jgi:hypothetical protein
MTLSSKIYKYGFVLLVFTLVTFPSFGQPRPPDPIPVTGIEWLLIGGGLWGAKKIYDGKKKQKQ